MAHKLISQIINQNRFFVYKIIDISYRQRLFCIFDSELPCEMQLSYKEINTRNTLSPILGGGKIQFVFNKETDTEKLYEFRMTEDDCKKIINEVNEKQKMINDILNGYSNDLIKQYKLDQIRSNLVK
jgi:hypothetical protein